MKVACITIEGENAIISADKFDWLCAQAAKVEKLEKVAEAAVRVVTWDWSDNDAECEADMRLLRAAVEAL
jgi:hypothetical protein